MFAYTKSIAAMILVLALVAGCAKAEPTAPPAPPVATAISPTATPAPTATPTESAPEPTATPTATRIEPTPTPALPPTPTPRKARYEDEVVAWLQENGVLIDSVEPGSGCDDLQSLMDMIGDARIVALGEATHATSEFFTVKHRIIECLVREKGFNLFGIEATWPEATLINDYVLTGKGDPELLLSGLYMWWWNTQEVLDLISWMRAHNANPGDAPLIQFYGVDMQYPRLAMDKVVAYVEQVAPEAVEEIEALYACYRPYQGEGSTKGEVYNSKTNYWYLSDAEKEGCRDDLKAVYDFILSRQPEYEAASSPQEYAFALHSARIVQQAEQRYANIEPYHGHGHYRDLYMAENASWLLDQGGPDAKIILWAHNSHIKDREESLGGYLREVYGDDMVIVGFDFYSGSFHAKAPASNIDEAWSDPIVHELATPVDDSFEYYFHQTGVPQFYVDLRALEPESPAFTVLGGPLLFCAHAGTDYDANSPNLVVEKVPQRYDIMIYLDETSPSSLLPMLPVFPGGLVEASPSPPGGSSNPRVAEIEALMAAYEQGDLFSGAVLVAEGGEIVYERGVGYANREWLIPNAPDTRFRIASLSKLFTKVLLLQLEEEGKLSLTGTIAEYVPDYTGPGADIITINRLLNHQSGIATESSVQNLERIERDYYTQEEMLEFIAGFDLLSEPGTEWAYSNFGYYLLGVILERASGLTFGELLKERICDPAGMTDTFPEVTSDVIERRASGYWYYADRGFMHDSPLDMSFVFGYGQLISTIRDLYLFDRALREGKLLNQEHTHALVDAEAEYEPLGNGGCEAYVVEDGPGSINGFRASTHSYTRENRLVVVLENTRSGGYLPGVFDVGRNIAAILYGCSYDLPAPAD